MNIDFTGKTAIVTGGASGIGYAIAEQLADSGATVIVADLDQDKADAAAKEISASALGVKVDVGDEDSVQAMVRFAKEKTGRLDYLVNNAGIGGANAPLGEYPTDSWRKVINVNLNGVFYGLRYAIPEMKAAGGGAIVNTASVAGVVADPGMAPYVAAKHGVVGLGRAAALDYATQGIRVNTLAPGLVESAMTKRWLDDPKFVDALMANSPIGRAAKPEEMSGMVLFLCSDAASFATGQVYLVDGGQTAH